MGLIAGYNSTGSIDRNPDGSIIIGSSDPKNPITTEGVNTLLNIQEQEANANAEGASGNLITAANNEAEDAKIEATTSSTYTGLDNIGEGFEPSKLNKADLTTFQGDLMNAGFDLPEFGADGGWGAETEGAWNAYSDSKNASSEGSSQDSMLAIAANNENLTNTDGSVDQNADKAIKESVTQMDANGNLTDGTNNAAEVDPNAAKNAAKKEAVSQFFSNMSFGEYSNPFARR